MKTTTRSIEELLKTKDSPLPLSVIPNYMGINLCSVDGITWTKQEDGQLVDLIIHFKPNNEPNNEKEETPKDGCDCDDCNNTGMGSVSNIDKKVHPTNVSCKLNNEEDKHEYNPVNGCEDRTKDTEKAHFCTSACGKLTIGPYCNWCGAAQKVKINDDGPIPGFSSDLEWLEYLKWKAQQHTLVLEVETNCLGLKYDDALLFQCDNNEKGLIKIDVYLRGFEAAYNLNASTPMFATFEKFESQKTNKERKGE